MAGSILVVDDDLTQCKLIKKILEKNSYAVDYAITAKEGLRKSKRKPYDLVLLDIQLPDMLGTRILAELKKHKIDTIKIMVSGSPHLGHAIDSVNLGADAFIPKPFEAQQLLQIIAAKLAQKNLQRSLTDDTVAEWLENRFARLSQKKKSKP